MKESWGRCDKEGNAIYEDRGPRTMNTFDKAYSHHAPAFRADIRGRGYDPDPESVNDQGTGTGQTPYLYAPQRSVGEMEYVSALGVLLDAYRARMEAKPRQNLDRVQAHLNDISLEEPQETSAEKYGVTQQSVSEARQRAVEQLRETIVRVETGGHLDYTQMTPENADQVIRSGFLWGFRRQGVNIGYGTYVPGFVRRSK